MARARRAIRKKTERIAFVNAEELGPARPGSARSRAKRVVSLAISSTSVRHRPFIERCERRIAALAASAGVAHPVGQSSSGMRGRGTDRASADRPRGCLATGSISLSQARRPDARPALSTRDAFQPSAAGSGAADREDSRMHRLAEAANFKPPLRSQIRLRLGQSLIGVPQKASARAGLASWARAPMW